MTDKLEKGKIDKILENKDLTVGGAVISDTNQQYNDENVKIDSNKNKKAI